MRAAHTHARQPASSFGNIACGLDLAAQPPRTWHPTRVLRERSLPTSVRATFFVCRGSVSPAAGV